MVQRGPRQLVLDHLHLRRKRTGQTSTDQFPYQHRTTFWFLTAVMNFCQGYSHCDMDCASDYDTGLKPV